MQFCLYLSAPNETQTAIDCAAAKRGDPVDRGQIVFTGGILTSCILGIFEIRDASSRNPFLILRALYTARVQKPIAHNALRGKPELGMRSWAVDLNSNDPRDFGIILDRTERVAAMHGGWEGVVRVLGTYLIYFGSVSGAHPH